MFSVGGGVGRVGSFGRRGMGGASPAPASPPEFLPTFSVAPSVVYGQGQVVSTYSGPALRVVRASDSATLDIPIADRVLDVSGVPAFGSGTTMAVDVWYDQSAAAGGNATQSTGSQRPTFRLENQIKGSYPFVLDGTSAGMDLPAIVTDRRSVTILAVMCVSGSALISGTSSPIMRLGSDASSANNLSVTYRTARAGIFEFQAAASGGEAGTLRPNVALPYTFALKTGQGRSGAAIDNTLALTVEGVSRIGNNGNVAAGSLTGGRIGPSATSESERFPTHYLFFAVYPGILSSADIAEFEVWASHRFGTLVSAIPSQVILDGDSITATVVRPASFFGAGGSYKAQQRIEKPFRWTTAAISGQLLTDAYANRATTMALYSAARVANYYYLAAGTNDIEFGGATDMNALYTTNILGLVAAAQTAGMATPIIATVRPRTAVWDAAKETRRLDFNTLIRDGAAANGYVVADVGGIAADFTSPGVVNAANFSDGLHRNEAGYALEAPVIEAAMIAAGWTAPLLSPLVLSRPFFPSGTAKSGPIGGVTPGSTLSATGLPAGLTIDSANRRWVWDGTGPSALSSFTLVETLAGASNSPRNTTIAYGIGAAYDTFTEVYARNILTHVSENAGTWAAQPGEAGGANITQLSRAKSFGAKAVTQHSATMPNDQTVSANIVLVGSTVASNACGIFARGDGTVATYYRFRYIQGTGFQLHSVVAGVATQRGSTVAGTAPSTTPQKMTLEVSGTTNPVVVCKVDGVAIITFTHTGAPAGLTGGGKAGIYFEVGTQDTEGYQLEDFHAGGL